MEKRKSNNFLEKEKLVAEIAEKAKNAKSIVFVDYKGITVAEDTELRTKFRDAGVDYKIYKNRLVKIALNSLGITDLDDKLKGSLSVAFSNNDEVGAVKVIKDMAIKGKVAPQFGLIGTSVLLENDVKALANLPSKEVLIAKIMGLLSSGAQGIASCVNGVAAALTRATAEASKKLA